MVDVFSCTVEVAMIVVLKEVVLAKQPKPRFSTGRQSGILEGQHCLRWNKAPLHTVEE